jgi:8-amino-7-oxononanoate synthase
MVRRPRRASGAVPPEPSPSLDHRLAAELARLKSIHRYRQRRVIDGGHTVQVRVDGQPRINFCSNDYLGLATDPAVIAAAQAALAEGCGSTASPMVGGYNRHHAALEAALAEALGYPRVLLFSSGWAANLGVLRALLGRSDPLYADELNHASLIDGGRLSGAQYARYPHADLDALDALLAAGSGGGLIVSDAVFSMDGDLAALPRLTQLSARHGVPLMMDDAHGFGVFGGAGGCLAHWRGQPGGAGMPAPEIYVGTLGKSLGAAGAFVAGSETLIEYLIQRARTWVFSTAPPPALAAAAIAALRRVQSAPELQLRLHQHIAYFRAGAAARGLSLLPSISPIQPLLLGSDHRALACSRALEARGYWVAAIRPPTVPEGSARLRITLSAAHTPVQIEGLLDALAAALTEADQAA